MPIRVVHILSAALWGGPSQVVVNLLAEGRRRGWTMTLVLLEHPGAALDRLGAEVRAVGAEVVRMTLGGPLDPRLGGRLRRILRTLEPDVVHCHGYKPALAALLAEPPGRRARVLTVHGWTARTWRLKLYEWLERRVLAARFERVFVVAPDLRDRLLAQGLPAERVVVTPNAFDPDRYRAVTPAEVAAFRARWGVAADRPVLGALGRLTVEKGHDVLLRALAELAGVQLVLIGDGPARADLERLAAGLGLSPPPVFAGETDQPLTALAALDLVVLPSRTEGLPQSLLESMALARPVVASAVGAVPEALDHGCAGRLVPADDPVALRQAIRGLLGDPDGAARLGARAAERVRRCYTLAALGDRLEREYRAVLPTGTGRMQAA